MSEATNPANPLDERTMPPGIVSSEMLPGRFALPEGTLPWVDGPYELTLARCDAGDGTSYLLGSAVGSHRNLESAAEAMTEKQSRNANNMFTSRLATFIRDGQAPNVDLLPKPVTDFNIHVMRNNGGQRVFFGITEVTVAEGSPPEPVVLRLGACDMNKQGQVIRVLTRASANEQRSKLRRSK